MKHSFFYIAAHRVFPLILVLANLMVLPNNLYAETGDDDVLEVCEQMPQFPGGLTAMMEYIQSNLVYPAEAADVCLQGKVIVQFIVDSLGYVGDVKVVRSLDELLDEEVVRVVKTFPRFVPGRQDGKAVNVRYFLPVPIKLRQEEDVAQPAAQPDSAVKVPSVPNAEELKMIFDDPEQMPQFPGGEMALMNFLSRNVRYPERASIKRVEGRVVVQFFVDEEGAVSDIKVVRSVDPDLDKEAIRVCGMLPKFSPGRLNGNPIKVVYTLPITFRIPRDNNQGF